MSESSNSDIESNKTNLQGYLYEPRRSNSNLQTYPTDTSSSSSDEDDTEHDNRHGNTTWCQCGKCNYTLLVNKKEHLCCQETAAKRLAVQADDGKLNFSKYSAQNFALGGYKMNM